MPAFEFNPYPSVAPSNTPLGEEKINATPAMFGGLVADATQKLGKGIESVGEAGLDYEKARLEITNEVHSNEKLTHVAGQGTDLTQRFLQLEGNAAMHALPKFQQDLRDLHTQSLEGENPRVQAMLSKGVSSLIDRYQWYAASHAAREERRWHDTVASDGAKSMGDVAMLDAQNRGWLKLDQSLQASDEHVETLWNQRNSDADPDSRVVVEREVARNRGANVFRIVKDLAARGQIEDAEAVLDHNRSKMDAGSIVAADSSLKTLRSQSAGHQIADEETGKAMRSDTAQFLKERGGKARVEGLSPQFADRLTQAAQDFEKETGGKARFESLKRTTDEQAEIYLRHQAMPGGVAAHPAAPPGHSRHEKGEAADIPTGPFQAWLHQAGSDGKPRAGQYGLEFLKGQTGANDPGHVQLSAEFSGPREVDKGAIYDRIVERTKDNPLVQGHAISRMNQIFAVERSERTQDHAVFQQRYKDTTAEAVNNGTVTNQLTEADFMRQPNMSFEQKQQAFADYQDTLALGVDLHAAASMSPAERDRLVPQMPQPGAGYERALQRRNAFLQGLQKLDEERKSDPGGYAIANLPDAKAAFQGMLRAESDPKATEEQRRAARANYAVVTRSEQTRVGVDPGDVRILPKRFADELQATITRTSPEKGPSEIAARISREADLWGDVWPQVARQINKAGPLLTVLGAGVRPAAAQLLADNAHVQLGDIIKDQQSAKAHEITENVDTEMAPFARSLIGSAGGIKLYGDVRSQIEKLAAIYAFQNGLSAPDAARRATDDVLNFKYDYRDDFRVPNRENHRPAAVPSDAIQLGAAIAKQHLGEAVGGLDLKVKPAIDTFGAAYTPDQLASETADAKRTGRWTTNDDETGLWFVYKGQVVRKPDGAPLSLTWQQLGDLAAGNRATQAVTPRGRLPGADWSKIHEQLELERRTQPSTRQLWGLGSGIAP